MKQIIAVPLVSLQLATPVLAQDEPSLMEQGAKQFFEGLLQEMAPALDELTQLMEEERWSRNFGPVVKVDRMMREVIPNEETEEPFV